MQIGCIGVQCSVRRGAGQSECKLRQLGIPVRLKLSKRPFGEEFGTERYMHTYMHTYVHTYMHTYVHTYMHTYIRTYMPT